MESPRAAEEMMNRDALDSWRTNHERDSKVAADAGLELRLPFAHPRIVSLGLSIPAEQKLPPQPGMPRKVVLRRLAETLGFPESVWARPKKAAQYSTGVMKALNRIAKRRGTSLRKYLSQVYRRVFEEERHA
jgi:asparagine synthase (glutamine-hydrolysing)